MAETARKLARIVTIDDIAPIKDATAIEVAHVGGWKVVVKKGEFAPGDRAIYVEIDSFLPEGHPAWQFLVDKSSRVYEERRGHVLRSVTLRGQVSQGLLLAESSLAGTPLADTPLPPGTDVAGALGIVKHEPPMPACLSGIALGPFPSRVPKTDQERIQNLAAELADWKGAGLAWEVTEKLEGSSCTFAWLDGVLHVCSRTLDLADTPDNSFWQAARALQLASRLGRHLGARRIALQGELIGHGIQGNIYDLKHQQFHLYDIYDVDQGRYLASDERLALSRMLDIPHVPLVDERFVFSRDVNLDTLLAMADGPSAFKPDQLREGLVFKALGQQASFKVISNKYLLKQKG